MILLACFIIGMVSNVLSDSARCAPLSSLDEPLTRLSEHFNINHHEVSEGGELFTKMLKRYKQAPESGIVLNVILQWYLDLFNNLKHHNEVKNQISLVANSLQECLKSRTQNHLISDLEELSNIKWDDQLVQRKAILELDEILTTVKETGKRRRKRNMGRRQRT
ncbi:interferon gamma-like [Carcharodon carcharias]|uniref:interferon gamma-like n=1 Tax=Carcharodon carcharias TaxID=13397 RepID=UPI001B7E37A6|nr:interferon gamma-like [Carcharodon carcharias]